MRRLRPVSEAHTEAELFPPLLRELFWAKNRRENPDSRMVKKLMRLRAHSISAAPQAVRDTASGLDALCLG